MNRTFLPAPSLPGGKPLLVVTGFMGTGKTAGGSRAAEILGVPFFDLDEIVSRRAGVPVPDLIVASGEAAFRDLERGAVLDAARLSGAVVATGGGAALDESTFARLTNDACVAVLSCSPGEALRRVGTGTGRPLLAPDPADGIDRLLRERAGAYARAGANAASRVSIDTSRMDADEVGRELSRAYRTLDSGGRPTRIRVDCPEGSYPVIVGDGVIEQVGESVSELAPDARAAVVVVDPAVGGRTRERVSCSVRDAGLGVRELEVPSGEESKSIDVVAGLWSGFREARLEATDVVVAVGGGATLDTAGFAAATYARGVDLVHVPTTLLAMADAAIGGKVGLDHAGVKNLVGSFHQPRVVVADPTTLATVPPATIRAGLAEVVKAAVLASPLVLDALEAEANGLDGGVPASLGWIVEQAVRVKAGYAAEDPRDRGLRRSLNLGHTFAHALEAATGFELAHGDAVSVGLVAAARVGEEIGSVPSGLRERLAELLSRLGLPTEPPPDLDPQAILAAMTGDKKRRSGRAVLVLPAPGGAELVEDVPPDLVLASLLGPSHRGSMR